MINMTLAKRMNLTDEQIATVEHLQLLRRGINLLANTYVKQLADMDTSEGLYTTYVAGLRTINYAWVRNEFDLQTAWGFPLDAAYHRFWEFPGCTCPKFDNIDDYPHLQYHSEGCLLHGNTGLTQVAE